MMRESANDAQAWHEQLSEHSERSSPARRVAAYHPEVELVGRSQAFIEVMNQVDRVSNNDEPVLLIGEAGTGKELIAAAIHQRSDRAGKPFVRVNCGAIPVESIEFELYGHVQNGGTVFLNDITETTPSFQMLLLRALQTGEIQRVGSDQTFNVTVRVIAGSNRNVEQEVNAGRFRNDLFYRLNAASIVLPPLRERPEDIAPLAQSFADRVYS
jgi:transcriptional regulator with GAF, ATPase, and Fis domain